MVSEGIFINGEKVTFNPENILNGDVSAYTEAIGEATQDWIDEHLEPGGSVPIDDTLSISGAAADAKETGDQITELKSGLGAITDIDSYKNFKYENTGTSATRWQANVSLPIYGKMYAKLISTENVDINTGELLDINVDYSDNTTDWNRILTVGDWYEINYNQNKNITAINIRYIRASSELSEPVNSVWNFIVIYGDTIDEKIKDISTEIINSIVPDLRYIQTKTGIEKQKSFAFSNNHSSTNDRIDIDIAQGQTFDLNVVLSNGQTPNCTWIGVKSDNSTDYMASGPAGTTKTIVATNSYKQIGVYIPNESGNITATITIKTHGVIDELESKVSGTGLGNVYSVNADGITKTYLQTLSMKKLYVPNDQQTGPSVNQQGAAFEDGKVIIATHEMGTDGSNCTLDIWDYETATRLYSFPVPNDAIGHGNNIIATGVKVADTDICSLLLISDSASAGSLYVCRLTESGCTVLHKIQFNVSDVGYYANFMYNELNGTIVSLGCTIESVVDPNNNSMIVGIWDIENWDDSNGTPSATLRYKYTLPYMDIMNGGIIRNGIMYIMCTPFQYEDYTYVVISPIETKSITNRWNLNKKTEYENINFISDDTIMIGAYWFYQIKLTSVS